MVRRIGALNRMLLRDIVELRGPVVTLALVVAAGMASYVSLVGTRDALYESREQYYEEYRLGDVFARVERAPERVRDRLQALPGVMETHTRVVEAVRVSLPGAPLPAIGLMVSIPDEGRRFLNGVRLVEGRWPAAHGPSEVLVSSGFARRWRLRPGGVVTVVVNERERRLAITGLAESPEFAYPVGPGSSGIPDDERFGVIWMRRGDLGAAFGMEAAFNDVVLALDGRREVASVLRETEAVLEPYGTLSVVGRDLQPSNYILEGELQQLRGSALVLPIIFLIVSAIILNIMLSRLVRMQRTQIAVLKAVGYGNGRIGVHVLAHALVIAGGGTVVGTVVGGWLGSALTELYAGYFGLPNIGFTITPGAVSGGALLCLAAASAGALVSVRNVVRQPAAEAMRPAPPARYRATLPPRIARWVRMSTRMALREVARRPLQTAFSVVAIAASVGIMVVGRYGVDAMEVLMDVQFRQAWREDVTVSLASAVPASAVRELETDEGVLLAEGSRTVPVQFRVRARTRDGVLVGYPAEGTLRRAVDRSGRPAALPTTGGLLLTRKLAEILQVEPGDIVRTQVREGERPQLDLRVAGLVDELFGLQGYMALDALNRALGSEPVVNGIQVDGARLETSALTARIAALPAVLDASAHAQLVRRFREQSARYVGVMTLVVTVFAAAIAVGVLYNHARVALSIRQRDFASLRVLGFTTREVAGMLTAELVVHVLLAVPLGLAFGRGMSALVAASVDPERYRLPTELSPQTYLFGALVIVGSAVLSLWILRSRLDHLDLIGVLKTRE